MAPDPTAIFDDLALVINLLGPLDVDLGQLPNLMRRLQSTCASIAFPILSERRLVGLICCSSALLACSQFLVEAPTAGD